MAFQFGRISGGDSSRTPRASSDIKYRLLLIFSFNFKFSDISSVLLPDFTGNNSLQEEKTGWQSRDFEEVGGNIAEASGDSSARFQMVFQAMTEKEYQCGNSAERGQISEIEIFSLSTLDYKQCMAYNE